MPFDVTNIYLWRLYFITDNCCESCFKRRSIGLTWGGEIYISAAKPIAPAVWWPRAWLTARNFYEWRPTYRTARRIVNRFNMGRSIYVRHWGLLALVFQLPFKIQIMLSFMASMHDDYCFTWLSACGNNYTNRVNKQLARTILYTLEVTNEYTVQIFCHFFKSNLNLKNIQSH